MTYLILITTLFSTLILSGCATPPIYDDEYVRKNCYQPIYWPSDCDDKRKEARKRKWAEFKGIPFEH